MKRPSNHLLGLIHDAGEDGLTLAALDAGADLERKSIRNAIEVLKGRGLIERVAPGQYRLTAAGRLAQQFGTPIKPGPEGQTLSVARRYPRCLRGKLWAAMRALGKFSLDDLLLRAAKGDEADARNNALKYVNALERAGYLVRMRQRQPGTAPTSNGFVRWLLVRNTGPQAPIWQNAKGQIHDPNSGETFDLDAVSEVAHA